MPLRQYFTWVGSILLVALFAADWCLPAPLPAPRFEVSPQERVNLRIRSDHKWPDKVVFDTTLSQLASVADAGREPDAVPNQKVARAGGRTPLDALAAMMPVAQPSAGPDPQKAGNVEFHVIPSTLPQSGRMNLGFAVSRQIPEGSTSRATAEISGAEHEGHFVCRYVRQQAAVPRRICIHAEASRHQSGRGDDQAASLRTDACASAADAEILLTASA
jgi:hypothetical protein